MSDECRVFRELAEYFLKLAPQIETHEQVVEKLLEKINERVETGGYIDILIQGGQGMGKSTLALYIMYRYYGDPREVLRNVFFRVEDLEETLLVEKRRVVLLDDAGITLSKYKFMSDPVQDYIALQQLARTRVSCVIYTTVYDNLAKHIRDIVDYVIALHTRSKHKVYGSLYVRKSKLHTVSKTIMEFAMDLDKLHENQEFHNLYLEYSKRREEFVEQVIRQLLEKRKKQVEKEKFEADVESRAKEQAREESEIDEKLDELRKSLM